MTARSLDPFLAHASPHVRRLLAARGLRAFADGCISIVLPLHLTALGFSPLQIGIIATGTLLGSGVLTLGVGMIAHRFRYRSLLLGATLVMGTTGLAVAGLTAFWPLLVVAIVGTLNPSSGDVSVFLPIEHAVMAEVVQDRQRTAAFARYSLTGSLAGAAGALMAAIPDIAAARWNVPLLTATQAIFVGYAAIAVGCGMIYRSLPASQARDSAEAAGARAAFGGALGPSKRIVLTLAALFSLDAFAGGFIVQSLLALWLFQRFELSPTTTGVLFFWTGTLSAFSFLVAVRIAKRIGLLHTMVFTHLPSSLFLLIIPFLADLHWVVALLLVRSALSQMDIPTRTSYVMAVVTPRERAAAASITSAPRSLAAAASPLIAGYLLALSTFGWPLFVAGVLKIVYDVLLLITFRRVRPPEERTADTAEGAR